MDFKNITQSITKIFVRVRRGYAGDIAPERDWFFLLGLSGILLLASVTVNAISFVRVYEGEPISTATNTAPDVRETVEIAERLENVNALFEARAAAFEQAIETQYPFVDPARN